MAKVHGVAGEWARVKGAVFGLWPLFLGVFVAGFAAALILKWPLVGASLLVVALVFVLWCFMRGLNRVKSFYVGARGEERVSGILQTLPEAYHVFNDYAFGGHHVDHVVVGPSGVFAIETKFWRGQVTVEDGHVLVDGHLPDRPPLSQAVKEATQVRNALQAAGWKGLVTPVLAFASDSFTAHRANVKGTIIINSNELRQSFETERVVIPPSELERLVSIIENNL